mmetsp:Transcript_20137/g.36446  ORF Transcript_20137/g.36446 Transcript_20137/m.36446 type:complete len:404 (-) Transcript_20137:44-1255(-)
MPFSHIALLHALFISRVSAVLVRSTAVTSFEEYLAEYRRDYSPGSHEYAMRRGLFQERYEQIQKQNQNPLRLWTAGLNHFTDQTAEELKQLFGRIHHSAGDSGATALLSDHVQTYRGELAEEADWRHLASARVKDQGACGSCWAVATSSLLELTYELHLNETRTFSIQELVDCVPNPRECGGSGGCQGATVELAMTYAQAHGLSTNEETPYTAGGRTVSVTECQARLNGQLSLHTTHGHSIGRAGLTGWETLPSNKALPLMLALMEGPVAVSVGASEWPMYTYGVFDACSQDSVINHAVLGVGYGSEAINGNMVNYWTIQNSWGPNWGEAGYVRLLRMATTEEDDSFCGIDARPEDGVECKPYPETVTVCGMCGVLYDSVSAHFDKDAAGQLDARLRGRQRMM